MNERRPTLRWWLAASLILAAGSALAQTNTLPAASLSSTPPLMPDASGSVLRVFGALIFVIGIFLGGVWLFKNWQRVSGYRGRVPKLNVLETRSLGSRQAVYVLGYEQERFLIASSPAGITLLSHLPAAAEGETAAPESPAPAHPSFAQALSQVLKGRVK